MEQFNNSYFKKIKEGEKIIKVIHRHWFDIVQQFLIVAFLIVALIGGFFAFPFMLPDFNMAGFYILLLFLETTFLLFVWIYSFLIWVDYYFDVWIITSERIVNIEQKGLFTRQISELKFSRVQDVTADVGGFFQTVLDYGDVHIQTAGEEARFLLRQVPDPYRLKSMIMELQKHHESERISDLGEMLRK